MVMYWLRQRYKRIPLQEKLDTYYWDRPMQRWELRPDVTGERLEVLEIYQQKRALMYDRILEKRELEVQRRATYEIPPSGITLPTAWAEYKAYIVWYSGEDYKVRREIYILFWVGPNEIVDEGMIRNWLDQAVKKFFGLSDSLDGMQSWNGANIVLGASTGMISDSEPYTSKITRCFYTKNNKQVRRPQEIYRWG